MTQDGPILVPPGEGPDAGRSSLGATSLGLDPKLAAVLSYLIGWVTGVLILLLERENRYVRFHAMQSVVGLGGLWALGVGLWMAGFAAVFVSPVAFRLIVALAQVVSFAGIIAWLICLFKAYSGERWKLPLLGDVAARLIGEG